MSLENGVIISFKDKFGFIKNKDGVVHYFNDRLFKKDQDLTKIKVGAGVEFEAVATSKGMRAKSIVFKANPQLNKPKRQERPNVSTQSHKKQTYTGYARGERFVIGGKNFEMNKKYLSNYTFFYTGSYRNLEEAKEEAESTARRMGANYLVYNSHEMRTNKEGNYIYNTHHFTCTCGVYFVPHQFNSEEEARSSQVATHEYINKPFGPSKPSKSNSETPKEIPNLWATLATVALTAIFKR